MLQNLEYQEGVNRSEMQELRKVSGGYASKASSI